MDKHVHLILVFVVEWGNADDHFVYEHSECPPIESVVMARANDHLWRDVFGSSTERIGLSTTILHQVDFSEAEISKEDVPVKSQKDVLWLEVSVVDIRLV